ncbi:MAG: patatin-like phospholipase family protein [Deltaproteobacteria bacterium]|nr:patatin-like phospholipase family protein [Deltaproteobacteria bacterium]
MKAHESSAPVRGVVLSGGGARGAYETGVLAYLLAETDPKLWRTPRLQILSGTSVGAIHACYLAAAADRPQHDITRLLSVWRSFRLDRVLRFALRDVLHLPTDIRAMLRGVELHRGGVLLNSEVLQSVVIRDIAWPKIRQNLAAGRIDAVTVSATQIGSGRNVVFVDAREPWNPPWSRDPRRVGRAVRLRPAHALASAAIPLLFPAIAIDGQYHCDGGLRQNTPVSPALRLGVDRLLVIATRPPPALLAPPPEADAGPESYPKPLYLVGKLLDALMLDRLEYDLTRLEGVNRLIRDGTKTFGPDFAPKLAETIRKDRGHGFREVKTTVVRPSCDIGAMATQFAREIHPHLGGLPGWLLSTLGRSEAVANSDLMSYLMFDGRFAEQVIQLGMADADARRAELIEFLRD